MKKTFKIFSALALVAIVSSCSITTPVAVTEQAIGSKSGVSSSGVLFGAIELNKDYSVAEAAKNGGITGPIATVDEKISYHPLAFIIFKKELIVTGQ